MKPLALYSVLLALAVLVLSGCTSRTRKKESIWTVTLNKEDKNPYGTYIAYQSLPKYFPGARRESLSRWFRYTSIDERMSSHEDSISLLVMVGLDYYLSDEELASLVSFMQAGNEVLLFTHNIDYRLETALHCDITGGRDEEYPLNQMYDGSENIKSLHLFPDTTKGYGFAGRSIQSFFRIQKDSAEAVVKLPDSLSIEAYKRPDDEPAEDTSRYGSIINRQPEILGRTRRGGPDFIRYQVGTGHLTLHAAPLALSNYFLLQDGNREYLDGIWHSFPANISSIYWNEYFKRTTEASHLGILWRYAATRWALLIALFTLIVYVLLGIKRRQRIVPVIPPVQNASVSFVETVGRLYFNKGDHANLAGKMIQHFLEWVRTHYYLDTAQLNESFARQLAAKSGKPEAQVQALVQRIHEVRLGSIPVTGPYLYELHQVIQSFYDQS